MLELIYSSIGAVVILFLSVVIARLIFRKDAIATFGGAFSNPGFFEVPLIADVLGAEAVFYIAPFIAVLNMLQWTYGVTIMISEGTEKKKMKDLITGKKIFTALFMIAIIIGLILFLGKISISAILSAMFAVGVYLGQVDIGKMLGKGKLYLISFVRLLLVPIAAIPVMWLMPAVHADMKIALFIVAACRIGSNIAVYAQLHDKDYSYAVESVVVSTLLSVASIPLLVYVVSHIF